MYIMQYVGLVRVLVGGGIVSKHVNLYNMVPATVTCVIIATMLSSSLVQMDLNYHYRWPLLDILPIRLGAMTKDWQQFS